MISYAGTYTVEGDKVIHHVEISWNQTRNGTDLVRSYKVEGDLLTLTTAPARSEIDGKEGRSILIWKKVEPASTTAR